MTSSQAPAPRRLAIILSHPTQYYCPWFQWLREHTSISLRVFYLWNFGVSATHDRQFQKTITWDIDLLSGYEHEFVPNTSSDAGTHHFGGLRNPTLTRRLAAWQPDALLIFGYKSLSHMRAIGWARRHRVPLIFRGDSHFLGRGLPSWPQRLALRILYAQFTALTYVGAANLDYFTALGTPSRKLFFAPHAVNAALFDPARPETIGAAETLRAQLGLTSRTRVVLFAGKLVAAKQPRELLASFLGLRPRDAALVIVGEGPEKPGLLELARQAPVGTVHFLPFANQTEMPARYRLADIFALPSRGYYETWGLAVNEAMHLGVPCLVSDLVGCQRDLVRPGETGWLFSAQDPRALATTLQVALQTSSEEMTRLRSNALATIARHTYQQTSDGLLQALASLPAR